MNELKSLILALVLLTILISIVMRISYKEEEKIRVQHNIFGYMFMIYLIIALAEVVGFPSISEWRRLSGLNEVIFNPNINLIPFKDGFDISGILNIIFFMPFGFLLPTLWKKYRSFLNTLSYGIIFSFIIEIGQLFTKNRATDINDLIMNTLGTIIGWIIFNSLRKVFSKLTRKTVVDTKDFESKIIRLEPYLYVFIAIISVFII
ncbi:MAG: VanZ family protein [Clostridium sp.]|uniref:VanZ family protein n=1 Tax=Clostridium sp. TaxID=1506 RepID=UPI0029089B3A|nr:VanZ family protein [Clostridium sp.]MDU5109937.1 VanZ family protein [Clostridium sp.]